MGNACALPNGSLTHFLGLELIGSDSFVNLLLAHVLNAFFCLDGVRC